MSTFSVYVTGISSFVGDYRRAIAVDIPQPIKMEVSNGSGKKTEVTVPAHFPYVRVPLTYVAEDTLGRMSIAQDWDISAAPVFAQDIPPNPRPAIRQTLLKFLHFQEVILPPSETPPS